MKQLTALTQQQVGDHKGLGGDQSLAPGVGGDHHGLAGVASHLPPLLRHVVHTHSQLSVLWGEEDEAIGGQTLPSIMHKHLVRKGTGFPKGSHPSVGVWVLTVGPGGW